jgi:hypothetical protein
MSDQVDWEFADRDDAKAVIRAAVGYLLKDVSGGDRGDIMREIVEIVHEVAQGLPSGQPDPPGRWHARLGATPKPRACSWGLTASSAGIAPGRRAWRGVMFFMSA